ncbi:ABC transporter permease [Candidatus Methanodesulfokora washburnensis]|jgi:iron(III) transport system permease protein|uniref:Iron ABC transporter permease n=1 Tax=Candidatus Methanodesulfokora washburnensis TaxID=2478471 RepID=A0A429GGI3_9CREN|nr:iron ABC transporter permease [Candidatus Methanodesulfokores washburnensis]RSN72753.1 iron ABC transporter permease [Candidatus Methanodesulfokores washburnensis]
MRKGKLPSSSFFPNIILFIVMLMVLPPIVILFLYSLSNASLGKLSNISLTFEPYTKLLQDSTNIKSILNSLVIASLSALFGTLIATFTAWIIVKTDTPLVGKLEPLLLVPVAISPFLYALSWTTLLDPYIGIINILTNILIGKTLLTIYSFTGLILVTTFACMPLAYIVIKPFFEQFDSSLEEASIISGASKRVTIWKITFGLAVPTMISAYLLAFVWCMEELGIPLILAARAAIPIASLRIYELTLTWPPNYNVAAALAIVVMIINIILYRIAQSIIGKKQWTTVGLRGFRKGVMKFGKIKYLFLSIVLIYIVISSILPIIGMVPMSLSKVYGFPSRLEDIALDNYVRLLSKPLAITAIKNSIIIATLGSFILLVFTFLISYIVNRTAYKAKNLLDTLSMFPLSIPSIVIALGIFLYFLYILPTFIYVSIFSIMLGMLIRFIGHGTRAFSPVMKQVHQGLEDAARISGASQFQTIKDILIKLMIPSFISTYTFLFIYFVRELPLSILLATSKNMVWTAAIYSLWELGDVRLVYAFACMEIILILSVRFIGVYLSKREERKWNI